MSEKDRCAGTLQPIRGSLLGMCYGCALLTQGPSSLSGIAYLREDERGVKVWHCDLRKEVTQEPKK